MSEIRHPYKPKPLLFIAATVFFIGCAAILSKVALSNTQGIIFNRLIELSAESATIFYWCLVCASALFVIIGVFGIFAGFTSKNEIILTDTGLSAPVRPIGNKIVTINYSDITHLAPITVHGQSMLKIEYANGNATIQQNALSNKQVYNQIVNTIITKTQIYQG